MAPIIEVSKKTLKGLEQLGVNYKVYNPEKVVEAPNVIIPGRNGYIHVPSLNLDVAAERTHYNSNWHEAHAALAKEDARMLTMAEFREFLKYTRENNPGVYEDVTAVGSPWRAEWIDAFFEKRKYGLYVLSENKAKAEKLDGNTLMKNRVPGISLDSWLANGALKVFTANSQGLPTPNVGKGDLYYWHPEDGSAAGFSANSDRSYLGCNRDPSYRYSSLGVRAVKCISGLILHNFKSL